jgi:hypothetical protein
MAVRTPDPGKARAGVAAVEVTLDDLLDDRSEIPILLLEASPIIGQETLIQETCRESSRGDSEARRRTR